MNRRHLLHLVVAALGTAALPGSPTLRAIAGEKPHAQASRAVFDAAQRQLVDLLAEMIVPATDTPGALEAGVPAFIEAMVADWYTDTERTIFVQGLAALDQASRTAHGKSFVAADEAQRTALLSAAEQDAARYVSPLPGGALGGMSKLVDEHTPFFTKLKELTVIGYFSSEVGATKFMIYEPMPMRFDGDLDYAELGRQWSY
ncbi:MAG: gluconate 2-dehydrogenase subunit 3 family protein [Gammaproteobacteria bacterium]|jgi:hypothetical protein|nr:gluconate 2-dehydrogenase subunit 3 family protein [Gammaproteobacteria bacterium]MBP6480209.1 gluconate 2-dehydrogenase subunit 3 family protein [Pseudomonadales bacterium]MBP7908680.1 gluconate 2-dehydrogenase subunit 3 family protein [Pseudomonadales bacterium]